MATIYLIDDDLASELVAENLRNRGHSVKRFSSADDAAEHLDRIAGGDLVILDLIMPRPKESEGNTDGVRSTGMLIFRELRQRRANLPILIYSANQDPSVIDAIEVDQYARYMSRWESPKFKDFIEVVHQMLGIDIIPTPLRSFIVHGHDEKTKWEVKNYLQNTLNLPEPIILHEQPNLGRTIIEKFEDLAENVELAFVLLTPDDVLADVTSDNTSKRRARQNVIFELGFFLGMLGRRSGRVFLLYKGPLELPSDLSGVIYLDIENGVTSVGEQIRVELEALRSEAP